ncbi:MAG: hypothetical protein J7497_16570, partial [Chitinophagaceae bacterium]|nr:hypothetical protein [Chitinophagaceae bacterium]
NVYTHGSLYSSGFSVVDNRAYDTYSLLEDPAEKNVIDYGDPTKLQGGAFMDFDVYNVNAQGLSGMMRPHLLQGEVMGQNRKQSNGNPLSTYFSPGVTNSEPEFRFVGDFSNTYRQNYPGYANPDLNLRLVAPPFDGAPAYGDPADALGANYGYAGGNKLAGSRYIKVGATIQPSVAAGYNKNDRYQSYMIDGFSITNESGVTYHYALPAYSWAEESYQKRIDESGGLSFNRSTKSNPYAYTWYLTTITGPDFVDRNSDGKADANDWGYYVNFEYGKWSNNYTWRNPSQGYHRDEDNDFESASMGKKEVYYLNAVRTRTHVALFEKAARLDGKGSSPEIFTKQSGGTKYTNDGLFNFNSSQSLRLDRIYLLNAADYSAVANNSGTGSSMIVNARNNSQYPECELPANILDRQDVEAVGRTSLEAKAIRIIQFDYDYSLCQGTANSFDALNNSLTLNGKLTLKALSFKGKGAG